MTLIAKLAPARLSAALAWRFRALVGDQRVDRAIVKVAQVWRPHLRKPVFIGIAGSAGKTTTKELLHGVLSYRLRGLSNPSSLNALPEVAKVVLRLRPSHDFCIAELSEDKPGIMDAPLALLRPSIGIVTVVGKDHWSAFGSRDGIASELGKLVRGLAADGTAVLNADDAAVLAMAKGCVAKVITYGTSPTAVLRAEDVRSVWPERLQMTLTYGDEKVDVRTQLCGTHWLPAVLGAIGGGLSAGMSLAECAEAIAGVAPFDGRMQPVTTQDGVTFIRDDFKAPWWTLNSCFDFLKAAQVRRRIVVIGEISDVGPSKGDAYARAANMARDVAELTVFVGPWASSVLKTHRPEQKAALRVFGHVRDAAKWLNSITRDGDLVLLKGTNKHDHLVRIVLERSENVACWRDDCNLNMFCNECSQRDRPSGAPLLNPGSITDRSAAELGSVVQRVVSDEQFIVGLGNPETKYAGSPHNVGYEVVDLLAELWGFTWTVSPEAWIARGSYQDRAVCLIKVRTAMNNIGAGLSRFTESTSFTPEQCILVHDELALQLGTVKTRLSGGAGGHRGVASILEAFQTDTFRRVKMGIGQGHARDQVVAYVLSPWDAISRSTVDASAKIAQARIAEMIASRPKAP